MAIKKDSRLRNAILLTVIFTLALFSIINTLPGLINDILERTIIPDHYWDYPIVTNNIYSQQLGFIGFLALLTTIFLIVVGFTFQKLNLTKAGTIGFYLPIFAYFATTMGFLAGVGIFWLVWAPIDDLSSEIFRLGEIIIILPVLLVAILDLVFKGIWGSSSSYWGFVSSIIQLVGIAIFIISLIPWFYGKFSDKKIVDFGIYNYSRHPQYLGIIIWSYGFFLRTFTSRYIHLLPIPSLLWVITATIIIGIALYEDNQVKKFGPDWHTETPFMFPLPHKFMFIFNYPVRLILKKDYPETRKEILIVLVIYDLIIILLSIPIVLLFPISWQPIPFIHLDN